MKAPPMPKNMIDHNKVQSLVKDLLVALGEDPEREGLIETPRRIANFWREFIEYDAGKIDTTFSAIKHNQMVCVTGMRVWSMCEHHLLPFWCDVAIAYIADDKVLGLSKFARIAHKHAHKLTLQEQLVSDIANELVEILGTQDVAVLAKGEHLCMTMRGIKTPHCMISSALNGQFHKPEQRAEFFQLVESGKPAIR